MDKMIAMKKQQATKTLGIIGAAALLLAAYQPLIAAEEIQAQASEQATEQQAVSEVEEATTDTSTVEQTVQTTVTEETPEQFASEDTVNTETTMSKTSQATVATLDKGNTDNPIIENETVDKYTDENTVYRVSDSNRYSNAVAMSRQGWEQADTVVITNGETWADALTGSPLASKYGGPLLFVKKDQVPAETLQEMQRLQAQNAIILGSEASVSKNVYTELINKGFQIRRIGGRTRYDLSTHIADDLIKEKVASGQKTAAFLVSGEVFSDAMSIANVAATEQLPIYLTRKNRLDETFIQALPKIKQLTILGGIMTVSQEVEDFIRQQGIAVKRMADVIAMQ